MPGGAVKRVKAVVSSLVGKEFLICWKDQVSLGILHEDWPNIPGYRDEANAVRTDADDSEWPVEWLQEIRDVLEEYNDVFADKLTPDRRLEGEPMQIKVEPEAVPYQVSASRPVPYHWLDEAKRVMQQAVAAGIVIEVEEAVEWLAPAHMVEKPGQPGKLRLVTDFRRLSEKVVKDVHQYPNSKDVWWTVQEDSKVFFKLDATQSYH